MDKISVNGHSLGEMCRLCLTKDAMLIDIFYFSTEMRNQLSNIIMWCAPIQIRRHDDMPNFICHLCHTQLKKIHEFQVQIVQSDKTLRHYLQQLRTSDQQIKPEFSIQKSSEKHLNRKTNHRDATEKCKSIIFHNIFGLTMDEIAPLNYNSANKTNEEMPLKLEIEKPTDDNSLNLTECAEETLSNCDGREIVCEDSNVDFSYYTKFDENVDIAEEETNFKSANKINQEIPLKFEIKDEPMDDNSLNLKVEGISEGDASEIVCEDSNADFSYYNKLSENMDIIGKEENCKSAHKINQEMPLNFEKIVIKEEPTNDNNSSNVIKYAFDTVETCYKSDNSEICSKNSKINSGHIPVNNVAEYPGKGEESKKYISVNYEKHKKSTENKNFCDICNKNFTKSFTWKIHMRTHTGEKPYQCDVCNKCFSELSKLNIHKRTHTGEKPYQCDVCNKCFSHLASLNNHKRTHTGEKPFQCDVCNKCFCQLSSLNLHKRTHTGEKPYQCDVCNKCFSISWHLTSHKRTHTGEKPYQCDVCNKCFSKPYTLNIHKRTHTGEKPYQCDVCNKCFGQLSSLSLHKRTHTGEKPHQCDICNKCFSQLNNLNIHKRTHTGD